MRSPFLYFPGDRLSEAELSAARLDGDVVELGEGYIPADAVETPALRAASLAALTGDALAATHLSAAWVHGALDAAPARHTLQRAVGRRSTAVISRRLIYRDLRVRDVDLQMLGGVHVTIPVRTLADLARGIDDDHRDAARRLAALYPDLPAQAVAHLHERGTLPRKRAALILLAELADAGQEEVTRYTS